MVDFVRGLPGLLTPLCFLVTGSSWGLQTCLEHILTLTQCNTHAMHTHTHIDWWVQEAEAACQSQGLGSRICSQVPTHQTSADLVQGRPWLFLQEWGVLAAVFSHGSSGAAHLHQVQRGTNCQQVTWQSRYLAAQLLVYCIATDAFYNHYSRNSSISSAYVDGVSVTHGSLKHHIWTFVAANDELRADQWRCPCSRCDRNFTGRVPSYVGNDYFCDSGTLLFPNPDQAYTTNPIWDGSGCAPTSTCCNFNSPPWFCKKLPQPTTDDIELRVCRDQLSGDEDIHISLIEIYIA